MKPVIGTTLARQVAFVGPFAVGKTTAVRVISDTPVLHTEVHSSAAKTNIGKHLKETTTVGLDYGEWNGPDGLKVAVVGTPGQARFDTVRQSVMPRSSGVVLWLFGQHPEAELDCDLWLDCLGEELPMSKMTVAVTRLDEADTDRTIERFRSIVDGHDPQIPLIEADPRVRDDVAAVVMTALKMPAADARSAS